jgi:hypothetical protein
MARFARVVAVGIPHHITQRGNARRFIPQDEADRRVYLDLLQQSTEQHGVAVIGYCLTSWDRRNVSPSTSAPLQCRALHSWGTFRLSPAVRPVPGAAMDWPYVWQDDAVHIMHVFISSPRFPPLAIVR